MSANWTAARQEILTRIKANSSPITLARTNLSMFNQDIESWDDPAKDFTTPLNSVWLKPQIDGVPTDHPWVGADTPLFRLGLMTLSFFFIPGTDEDDFAAAMDPLLTAMNDATFGTVDMDEIQEPDHVGITENNPAWYRVDAQAGFMLQEPL